MRTTFEKMGLEGHPDENQLLLALEGELTPEDSATIDRHLGSCWECRARSHELQRGILAFVEYREKRYLPSLAPPPHDFRDFPRQLRISAGDRQGHATLVRIWRRLLALLLPPSQLRWAAAIATIMVIVLIWTQILNPPPISATELLTRAAAFQNPDPPQGGGRPVRTARQKLRISDGRNRIVLREFQWTIGDRIESVRWSQDTDLSMWKSPLTAEGFASWRESGSTKKDNVTRSGELWTLDTNAMEGAIKKASLVVRAKDFHPVAQHILFADNQRLDFEELSFEIVPQITSLHELESHQIAQNAAPKAAPVRPEIPVNLSETELAVRYLMFSNKWDLDEDLQFSRSGSEVVVTGTASSSDRYESIRAALGQLPNVRTALTAPRAGVTPSTAIPSRGQTTSAGPVPLLRDVLERSFPVSEERRVFIDRVLSASDTALSHAWVLKRLAERYNEEEESLLSSESRAKVTEMLRAHVQQLRAANGGVGPLINLLPTSAVRNPNANEDWRTTIATLFNGVQQQDSLVASLVAGTQANGQDVQAASQNLRNVNRAIQVLLERLEEDISALK
jgi:hypothetical protein